MPGPRGLLLAGTDTGVGKTALSQGLLRLASRRGLRLIPYKPVETGCSPRAEDADKLWAAAALPDLPRDSVCSYRFADPVAPSVAALTTGSPIAPGVLSAHATFLRQLGDSILVESAGGLLTPYANNLTSASLAMLFDIDILLVTANRLGCINHAALALEYIRYRALPLAGLVLVNVTPHPSPDQPHNAQQIENLTGVAPLGILRHCPRKHPDDLADAVATDINLAGLLNGTLSPPAAGDR